MNWSWILLVLSLLSVARASVVTWDSHSISLFGQRIFILAAEVHPWRLPGNPDLWADIFEKVKGNGFNTVSFYVNWAVHYPTPNTNNSMGDFEPGTYRDLQRFIDEGKKAGLWMIARPGPYINAETTGGGFPGWVGNVAGPLRTNSPGFMSTWKPYMRSVSEIIRRNQVDQGGPIILVQAENEFSTSANNAIYMQEIIDLYRAAGITVPITHNDQHGGVTGNFSPDKPSPFPGQVDIYCGDSYPQGANSWAQVQSVYRDGHQNVAPNNPLCLAEFGGGFLIRWGAVTPRGGTGFEKYSNDLTNADYENVFYKENYAQTTTILSIYMLFGGTNFGQTAAPVTYSSYDYGGGINENRVPRDKMNEMRMQGLFLQSSPGLLSSNYIANGTNYTSNPLIYTAELRQPSTQNGAFYFVRHNSSTSTAVTETRLTISSSRGSLTVPTTGQLTIGGREMKILVVDYPFGTNKILYSTAEILVWTTIDEKDYLVVYAKPQQSGEIVFILPSAPSVDLANAPNTASSYSDDLLKINTNFRETQFVSISTSDGNDIVLVILEKPTALNWHAPLIPGSGSFGNFFGIGTNESVLVSGPLLIRSARRRDNVLVLTGDLNVTAESTFPIEFIATSTVTKLTWNGLEVPVSRSNHGTLAGTITPKPFFNRNLPDLSQSEWKVLGSLPEISTTFDDSSFVEANLTATNYTNLPVLSGDKVLYSQQYGFYGGNLIFRGRFNATGGETGVNLIVQYGFAGGYSAFLNSVFLGSGQGNTTISISNDTWTFPSNTVRVGAENILVVVQDHTGITETSTAGGKEPRGIRGVQLTGVNTTFTSWKLQGNEGGAANTPDAFRGYLNEGGLYAERIGAHLPGFPDSAWADGSPLSVAGGGVKTAGINFYRTTFDLPVPDGIDYPIRLSITPSSISSNFRVQIYLNGWQVGKYFNNIGPQTLFVLPAGILRRNSTNTLALSLWSLDASGSALAGLQLVADGSFATSLVIEDYPSLDFRGQRERRPVAQVVAPM